MGTLDVAVAIDNHRERARGDHVPDDNQPAKQDQPANQDEPAKAPDNSWAKTESVRKDDKPDGYENKERRDR